MQTTATPSVAASSGVRLDSVQTVLVKFHFTNPNHVPPGIPTGFVSSLAALQNDATNATLAELHGRRELAEVGRVREGRVDTGTQAVNNLQLVQLGILRRGLTNVGFQLRSIKSFVKEKTPTSSEKHVVEMVFQSGGYFEEATATEPERAAHKLLTSDPVVQALRALANVTWQWCHVWDNSAIQRTATIQVGGRLPQGKPCHAIAVRRGEIVPTPVHIPLTESEE